ncbi:FKBP-type 22 kDa peptidyl-prolyl cis-trans isomerase [Mannheimia haemolytica]|uniref:Peptidyl-prolyl cis-trans isomerase n=1 Tax=Mannheimia haemolytica TaxID=75985 RepID=A0A378MVG1_MANHA|nr:FKBP-type 22 kDa peptidyl-prolyl cis-trans isomerase [Mannheimia haemolytica]
MRVHYTGSLIDGTVFDSSVKTRSAGRIPGKRSNSWLDRSIAINAGWLKWRLTIPQELAYGERGAGASIPPFATLVFEVELLDIL